MNLFITKGGIDSVFRLLGETHDSIVFSTLSECLLLAVQDGQYTRILLEKGLLSSVAILADSGDCYIQNTCGRILEKITSPSSRPGPGPILSAGTARTDFLANYSNKESNGISTRPESASINFLASESGRARMRSSRRLSRDSSQLLPVSKEQDIDDLMVLGGIIPLASVLISNTSTYGNDSIRSIMNPYYTIKRYVLRQESRGTSASTWKRFV